MRSSRDTEIKGDVLRNTENTGGSPEKQKIK
jgi:hypothetical protein